VEIPELRNLGDEQNYPYGQLVIASLLKGVLPVADVVILRLKDNAGQAKEVVGSRMMPADDIQAEISDDDRMAHLFIFREIFHDIDHAFGNAIRNSRGAWVGHYDFGLAAKWFFDEGFGKIGVYRNRTLHMQSPSLKPLLRVMRAQYAGENGLRFISSIWGRVPEQIRNAGEPFPKTAGSVTPERIQATLLRRIDSVLGEMNSTRLQ
jgi:hypothetical protein